MRKYALLTYSEYYLLNNQISIARGWTLGNDTERTYRMTPELAEISTGLACVMPISSEFQELYSLTLLNGITLHDSFVPSTESLSQIDIENMTTAQIDWFLLHVDANGDHNIDLIELGDEPYSSIAEPAIQHLVNDGVTIISPQIV